MQVNFSFVQITDHHLTASEGEYVHGFATRYAFRTVLQHIANNLAAQAEFVLSSGDLVDEGSQASYRAFLEMFDIHDPRALPPGPLQLSQPGLPRLPFYLMPGNHDDRALFVEMLFPGSQPDPLFSTGLVNAAFIYKGTQFILLDWGSESKASAHPEMLGFLEKALGSGLPAIIVMHHQLVPIGIPKLDSFIADDLTRFWELLHGQRVLGILCGHVHASYEVLMHGIPVYGLRSTAPPFNSHYLSPDSAVWPCPHYRVIHVTDEGLKTEVVEVPL